MSDGNGHAATAVVAQHDRHMERVVIAEAMSEPTGLYVGMMLELDAEDFVTPAFRFAFEEIAAKHAAGLFTGLVGSGPIFREVAARWPDEGADLLDMLRATCHAPPTSPAQFEAACRTLRTYRAQRDAGVTMREGSTSLLKAHTEAVEPIISGVVSNLDLMAESLATLPAMAQAKDVAREVYQEITQGPDRQREGRIFTDLAPIDELTGGFDRGWLVVVGARPSVGKSSFASGVALYAARHAKRVLYVGIEGGRRAALHRWLSAISGVPIQRIRTATTTAAERAKLADAAGQVSDLPIEINDDPKVTPRSIASRAKKLKASLGLDLVVVDYLQQLRLERGKDETREREVAAASQAFQCLARELECVVLLLSQLNRETAKSANDLPLLVHLRESGALEQDADVVLLLHRAAAIDPSRDPKDATCRIAKNRYGRTGDVKLTFVPEMSSFRA